MNDENSSAPATPGTGLRIERKLNYYAVLYLDLMGQRKAIAELEDLTVLRDNQPEYYHRFGEAAGKVWGVRVFLEDRLRRGIGTALASVGYPVPSVTIQMFADTIMIYFPWDKENPNAFITLYSLLVATAETVIVALASEIPVRGGLDVHAATEVNQRDSEEDATVIHGGDIWGPAPKLAYELAEHDHNYMRVRVGQGVRGLLIESTQWMCDQLAADPHRAIWIGPAKVASEKVVRLIDSDPVDNHPIVDYLGNAVAEFLTPNTLTLVTNAVSFAESAYNRLQSNSKSDREVVDKYEKLLTYIKARQQPNGIVPILDAR